MTEERIKKKYEAFYEALLKSKGKSLGEDTTTEEEIFEQKTQNDDDVSKINAHSPHHIYIKTEPAGRIAFGQLDEEQINLLIKSIDAQDLDEALEELRFDGLYDEAEGVVNSGDEGDFGNEGNIIFNENLKRIGPDKDGVYAVLMSLSKCSIEFEFNLKEEFDVEKFEEVSVPIRLPSEIEHGLYGHPDFNIITGFKYDGEEIEEEYEVIDRGYDDQFTIFTIKGGKTTILYSNYNGDEEWNDSDETLEILEALKN